MAFSSDIYSLPFSSAFLPSKCFWVSLFVFFLQPKEAEVEPINTPPNPTFPSEDSELSGEPIAQGTLETTNLSAVLNSSAEQGKS